MIKDLAGKTRECGSYERWDMEARQGSGGGDNVWFIYLLFSYGVQYSTIQHKIR